jgi:RNA polymerase sigma-70 factor (ECF subfamily)
MRKDRASGFGLSIQATENVEPAPAPAGAQLDQWLELSAKGDLAAFRRLYDQTSGLLFAQALSMLRRRDAAEDAVQEAYVRIWRRAGEYDPARGSAMPWLMRLLRNVVIDRMRQDRMAARQCDFDDYARALPAKKSLIDERLDLARALTRLTAEQLTAVTSVIVQGWTNEEVGRRLGIPTPTSKARVARGLKRLRACFEQEGIEWFGLAGDLDGG